MKPTAYFVEWIDDDLYARERERVDGEDDCMDIARTLASRDVPSLRAAHTLAHTMGGIIYRRIDWEPPEEPWAPWLYDTEIVTDEYTYART